MARRAQEVQRSVRKKQSGPRPVLMRLMGSVRRSSEKSVSSARDCADTRSASFAIRLRGTAQKIVSASTRSALADMPARSFFARRPKKAWALVRYCPVPPSCPLMPEILFSSGMSAKKKKSSSKNVGSAGKPACHAARTMISDTAQI